MTKLNKFIVTNEFINTRLDKYLVQMMQSFSRSLLQKLINNNHVQVNMSSIKECDYKLQLDDVIEVNPNFIISTNHIKPANIPLDIVYEDEFIIIINKSAGITVHPGAGNHNDTLVNALMYYSKLSNINGQQRPGIVHRLDRDTSGLIIVAKDNNTHVKLANDIANKKVKREYLALIYGVFQPKIGTIETYIDRCTRDRKKMAIYRQKGRLAITDYITEKTYYDNAFSMVRCILQTGRTHQIRVHSTYKKHPIIGDQVYGKNQNFNMIAVPQNILKRIKALKRQALHSYQLTLEHPVTKKVISFQSKLPDDINHITT